MSRARDKKGRFVKVTSKPLSKLLLGDLTALQILEEREPANLLETRAVYIVHQNWWEARHADAQPPSPPRG